MKILSVAYENYISSMQGREYPACFESLKQFENWSEPEAIAHTKPRLFPCRDCTYEYHMRMSDEGRCANVDLAGIRKIIDKG